MLTNREKRAANLIIYGIEEESEDQHLLQNHDKNFIRGFMETIGIWLDPKQITRLGIPNTARRRPVKVIMNNSIDKKSIMSRLSNLKNAQPKYRVLSVRDDYTIEERELIKEYVKEAKDKNDKENTTNWKVRGTPKNGLRVVKITTRQ